MEGQGYWILLVIFYLISMWAKKRQREQRRAQEYDTSEDGSIEKPSPRGSDLLSKMLREAGFEFPGDEPEEELVGEEELYEEPEPVTYTAPPPPEPDHKLETIRERIAEFDRETDTLKKQVDSHNVDWSVRKSSSATDAYDKRERKYSHLLPELDDLDDLREAIILREVFDKPRALRRRIR